MIIGQKVGNRYKIEKLIGGGGMSNVYLAHDIILDREVAIKILRYDFTNEEELRKRFHREALSATSLTHPNIVTIYDVGEDRDMHYIVMEHIEGKTLKKYIQEHSPLSPARTVHIMKQLTSAIAHAHDNGIVHRDIKPQNLLVDADGNVKITDFGIATTLSATSYTQTNSVIGTVHYLSPEQARGGIATNQSDIYALGIVMYELLTGELPFSGESAVAIALKHLQSETPSVRDFDASIPQSVENVVLKAMEKNVANRYATVQEMEADLDTVLSPARVNEPKYVTPIDNEATRLIPIIKNNEPIAPIKIKKEEPPAPAQKPVEPTPKPVQKPTEQPAVKQKKKWPLIAGGIFLFAVLAFIAFILLTPNKMAIPDVSSQTIEEATKLLEDEGFTVSDIIERNDDEVEKDLVIGTNPEEGTLREKGTAIQLIVSIGKETASMQNFVGSKYDQAMKIIQQYNFESVEEPEETFSDEPAGTILEQTPAAGEEIIIDQTTVKFVISKGLKTVKLADLKGYTASALEQYGESTGFKIIVKDRVNSDSVPVGSVVSQTPAAGTELKEGSIIEVKVSKGAAEKPVKYFVKDVPIPYTATQPEPIEEEEPVEGEEQSEPTEQPPVEQVVRIYIQDKNHTMAEPIETIKIKESTTYRIQLTIEEGSEAAYRISVDNNIIADEKIPYDY